MKRNRATTRKFAKVGKGQYHKVDAYTIERKAQNITRNGKRIHLKAKTIHVKAHYAHKPSKRR